MDHNHDGRGSTLGIEEGAEGGGEGMLEEEPEACGARLIDCQCFRPGLLMDEEGRGGRRLLDGKARGYGSEREVEPSQRKETKTNSGIRMF